jgi:hypothetical protein
LFQALILFPFIFSLYPPPCDHCYHCDNC